MNSNGHYLIFLWRWDGESRWGWKTIADRGTLELFEHGLKGCETDLQAPFEAGLLATVERDRYRLGCLTAVPHRVSPFEKRRGSLVADPFSNRVRIPVSEPVRPDLLPLGDCCQPSILLHQVTHLVSVHVFE